LVPQAALKLETQNVEVTRFVIPTGWACTLNLLADVADALVVAHEDATLGLEAAVAALKEDPQLSWIVIAAVAHEDLLDSLRGAGADVAVAPRNVAKLTGELARALAVA